jgi:hypothetical protein
MQAEIPDELIDLLERLAEGGLDEASRLRLVEMARERPELRGVVTEHFALSRALSQLHRAEPDFAERTAAHVAKVAAESEFGFARKVTGRIVRQRIAKVLAAAAVIALAVVPAVTMLTRKPEVAVLVRMDSEHGVVSSRPVKAGEKFDETSGLIRLDFHNGAVMAIEAPAKLTVVSAMEIDLKSGKLNGWCPATAHGFKVSTDSAELIDLGTSFGVTARTDGKAEFMVLDGAVEVQKGKERIRLAPGDAVKTGNGERLVSAEFNPSGFKNTWPLAQGILATKGAVVPADPDVPEKVARMESDDHVLVIPERRAVPFIRPLKSDIVDAGTLPDNLPDRHYHLQPVPPGRHLSSFLIRYDPVGTFPDDHFIRFEGEVTFDRPVVAILTERETLEASDGIFATGKWEAKYRGIELRQINNPPDSVTLSDDRRTVKVVFYAGASTDDIRVILED